MDSSDVNSVLPAVSPRTADDAEVASQRAPGQEEVVLEEPQGDLPDPRSKGDKTPKGSKSGFVPDTAPESSTVPDRGRRTPSKRSKPSEPAEGGEKRKAAPTGEAEGSRERKTPPPYYSPDAEEGGEEWPNRAKRLAKS